MSDKQFKRMRTRLKEVLARNPTANVTELYKKYKRWYRAGSVLTLIDLTKRQGQTKWVSRRDL